MLLADDNNLVVNVMTTQCISVSKLALPEYGHLNLLTPGNLIPTFSVLSVTVVPDILVLCIVPHALNVS